MNYTTLISSEQLLALIASGKPLRIFDCSFDLMQPHAGEQQYLDSHITGAVYANLDTALSAKHGVPGAHGVITAEGADAPASGGRHPLPNREKFATWLSDVGFSNDMQAVVYDRNGANYCGRLWWMLNGQATPTWRCWTAGYRPGRRRAARSQAVKSPRIFNQTSRCSRSLLHWLLQKQ